MALGKKKKDVLLRIFIYKYEIIADCLVRKKACVENYSYCLCITKSGVYSQIIP